MGASLFCIGVNHKTAPLELREALFLESVKPLLEHCSNGAGDGFSCVEAFVVATCNRFELYGVCTDGVPDKARLAAMILASLHDRVPPNLPDFLRHSYLHADTACVDHFLRVTASLDSLVIGETQITGQVKQAIAIADEAGTIGPLLRRLSQIALSTTKKIRTQTPIGKKTVSISHTAIDLARRVFKEFTDKTFLFVGAGEMMRLAAFYAKNLKTGPLLFTNRTEAHAVALANEVGFGTVMPWVDLASHLVAADVVLICTGASQPIITLPMMRTVVRARKGRPIFLVDIALPRNVDPDCARFEDVFLFDLDDLTQVVAEHREERESSLTTAEYLIQDGSRQFAAWLSERAVGPALAQFKEFICELAHKETQKTLGRKYGDAGDGFHKLSAVLAARLTSHAAQALLRRDENQRSELVAFLQELAQPLMKDCDREANPKPTQPGTPAHLGHPWQRPGAVASPVCPLLQHRSWARRHH